MSYMQFQQRCQDCGAEWNAAFGIVGRTQIAAPPKKCPKCGSAKLEKIADGWKMKLAEAVAPSVSTAPPILDPAIWPLLKFQISEDTDVDYSVDILIRQHDDNTGNDFYAVLATEPCKSRRDAQKTRQAMEDAFKSATNR